MRNLRSVVYHIEQAVMLVVMVGMFLIFCKIHLNATYENFLLPNTGYSFVNICLVYLHTACVLAYVLFSLVCGVFTRECFIRLNRKIFPRKRGGVR